MCESVSEHLSESPLTSLRGASELDDGSKHNGLRSESRLMADKITTVPKGRIGKRIRRLEDEDVIRLNRALGGSYDGSNPLSSVTQ